MIDEINPRGMPIYWLGAAASRVTQVKARISGQRNTALCP